MLGLNQPETEGTTVTYNTPPKSARRFGLVMFILAVLAIISIVVGFIIYSNSSSEPNASSPSASTTSTISESPVEEPATAPDPSASGTNTGYTVQEIESILGNLGVVTVVDNFGYERDAFGSSWIDVDNNGCDTRNDILIRDLIDVTIDTDGCRILTGTLIDSYTGETISFVRGQSTSSEVQIDHLVPLSRSWALGASSWDEETREAFANDPMNLFAVKGDANNNKSDQGFDTWTPAVYSCIAEQKATGDSTKDAKEFCATADIYSGSYYSAFDCEYAARYVLVSDKYDLAVTADDLVDIESALATCS